MSRDLADAVLARDPRAVARAISMIENQTPASAGLLRRLQPHTGRAAMIGVTGPPGAGKSTLIDRLTAACRAEGRTVGILAVDPSSAASGGAILGDRIRMQAHALDDGVFIRSMATRGALGGLARATAAAAAVLDAAGFDRVLVETVGVGQAEIDVVRVADVTIVVVAPGAGDDVQALKAGIMEIADIFVVNKADREGADRTVAAIESMLSMSPPRDDPAPAVLQTVALSGEGVPALAAAIEAFLTERTAAVAQRRARRAEQARFRAIGTAPDWLDHVAVAVADPAAWVTFLRVLIGQEPGRPEDVPQQGTRVRFVETGRTRIEILEPLGDASPVARFLRSRGPGLHHVAIAVEDVASALDRLAAEGLRLVDRRPRAGAEGTLVGFVHPAATGGVLVELVERADLAERTHDDAVR